MDTKKLKSILKNLAMLKLIGRASTSARSSIIVMRSFSPGNSSYILYNKKIEPRECLYCTHTVKTKLSWSAYITLNNFVFGWYLPCLIKRNKYLLILQILKYFKRAASACTYIDDILKKQRCSIGTHRPIHFFYGIFVGIHVVFMYYTKTTERVLMRLPLFDPQ